MIDGDDVFVAGRGDEDVGLRCRFVHGDDLKAFHRRLQGADRIDLGDHDASTGIAQRLRRAFADVAVTRDNRDLTGEHHIGCPADPVGQRFRGSRRGCRTSTW